jgi:hypothetical protein
MMLPILISVSVAPGSYFFCALAGTAARHAESATAQVIFLAKLQDIYIILSRHSQSPVKAYPGGDGTACSSGFGAAGQYWSVF